MHMPWRCLGMCATMCTGMGNEEWQKEEVTCAIISAGVFDAQPAGGKLPGIF
jgi:hypothetical protein